MNTETRKFRVDPHLIFDVISKQAGTLGKAILESVMNSVDAGATRCDITLSPDRYTVCDDGRGFASRDEIERFFETFGTPHEKGDATYGRFRIGRGQGFSFAENRWRSGRFEMVVDLKHRGLDYNLIEHETVQPGCVIEGMLYDRLSPMEHLTVVNEVKRLVEWMPITVTLNGERVSQDYAAMEWDHEDEDCYIKLKSTGGVRVYNLGAFVRNYASDEFGGVSGFVVSKRQLEVNFARNCVLAHRCEVYKRIRAQVLKFADQEAKASGRRMTADQRYFYLQKWASGEFNATDEPELLTMRLVPVLPSRSLSLVDLYERVRRDKVVILTRQDNRLVGEDVHRTGEALVVKPEFGEAIAGPAGVSCRDAVVRCLIQRLPDPETAGSHGIAPRELIEENVVQLSDLRTERDVFCRVLKDSDLTKRERALLRALRAVNAGVAYHVRCAAGGTGMSWNFGRRKIVGGESSACVAWTNGCTYVAFDRKHLRRMSRSWSGVEEAFNTLVHEYVHDTDDAGSHGHDGEFYETFHDVMQREQLGAVRMQYLRSFVLALHDAEEPMNHAMRTTYEALFKLNEQLPEAVEDEDEDTTALAVA